MISTAHPQWAYRLTVCQYCTAELCLQATEFLTRDAMVSDANDRWSREARHGHASIR
jgi:hypothetical protein